MIVELKIDGQKVDMDQKCNIAVTHSIADIEEPDNTSAGYSKSTEVPLTPSNMRVFRYTNELYSKEQFNNARHTAEYLVDGAVVMSGIAQIDKITYKFDNGCKIIGGSFHVSIMGAAFDWITNAKKQINALESEEVVKYNLDEVYNNSIRADESIVKFFPVDRGAFWEEDYKGDLVPRKKLDIWDYHPFFNVWKTMCSIFSGYAVKCSMEDFFKKLYCSGFMPVNEDLTYIKETNDFLAGSSSTGIVLSNIMNDQVYIRLFDKWIHDSEDDGSDNEYFVATEGILSIVAGNVTFLPTVNSTSAFKISLNYTCTIGKNGEVIDSFSFGTEHRRISLRFTLQGNEEFFTDNPGNLSYNQEYLVYTKLRNPSDFLGLFVEIQYTPPDGEGDSWIEEEFVSPIKPDGQYFYRAIPAGAGVYYYWKKKDGTKVRFGSGPEVEIFEAIKAPNGEVDYNYEYNTRAYNIEHLSGFTFETVFSASDSENISADNPLKITVGRCTIAPDFLNAIGYGEDVKISTIGGTGSQLDFLASLRQMFNLMYYTNPISKEIFIEPRTRFYNLDRAEIVDWREKIDYSKEIEVQELGGDIGKSFKLSYAEGNEVVKYYNWKTGCELGAYSASLLNKTSDDTKEIINQNFSSFLLRSVDSVGMTLLQEERDGEQKQIDDIELEVTPVVGYFGGLADRTAGEDIAQYPQYPQLVFQDAANGINLGFDDLGREPAFPGLRQYYEDNISAYNHGRRITMYLKLTPQDVEAIQFPNLQMQDFRAVFLLNFDGEDVPCLLEQIADYNPASGASTKCVFVSDPNIRLAGDDLTVISYDDVAISRNSVLTGYR